VAESPRLTRDELALLDRLACQELGLPSVVLMENAGRGAAEAVLGLRPRRVAVFSGGGNNGGDACVVARHLANAGVDVSVLATHPLVDLRGDAALMRRAVECLGVPVHDAAAEKAFEHADVLVDGLLGTGFRGTMRPATARVVEALNERREAGGVSIVALDLPSGLDADTGRAARPTVSADLTVTFAALKVGFDAPAARPFLGRVVLATIGVPSSLIERVRLRRPD